MGLVGFRGLNLNSGYSSKVHGSLLRAVSAPLKPNHIPPPMCAGKVWCPSPSAFHGRLSLQHWSTSSKGSQALPPPEAHLQGSATLD